MGPSVSPPTVEVIARFGSRSSNPVTPNPRNAFHLPNASPNNAVCTILLGIQNFMWSC